MPLYTLNRNYLLRTTSGVISFNKGEPTHVPSHMEREVVAIGAEIAEGSAPELLEPEKKLAPSPVGDDRREQIATAIELIVDRNESNDFTGSGRPSVKAVERILGFDVDQSEVNSAWNDFKAKG